MTKILYIVTQSEHGGAQRYVLDLATHLNKSQYEIHVATGGGGWLLDSARAQKINVHHLKHLTRNISLISDIAAYFELKKLIFGINPDIVHLNSSKAGFLGSVAAKSAKIPKIIYTAHGFVFNEPMNPVKLWLYKKAEILSSKRINKIICVSEYDRTTGIKAGINADKLITIHNGIDTDIKFLSKDDARKALREKNNGLWIGCIANFYHTKGLDILIQAMTKIDAQLTIIGDGILRAKLEEQIKNLGLEKKIILLGSIENASRYLLAFDLFVLPSRKEGLSYTLLEAAATGIPIVATKVGGTPEIIKDNINGYLAEPSNSEDLAQKINHALVNPLDSKLSDEFSSNKMLEKTLAIYKV